MDRINEKEERDKMVRLIVDKCIKLTLETDFKDITYTQFDKDKIETVKTRIATNIKNNFK